MKPILTEKRLFPRINAKLLLRMRLIGQRKSCSTRIKDIGVNGIGFVHENFISPGTDVHMELAIPKRFIHLGGKVAWSQAIPHSDRYRVGIEFTKINYNERCDVADYINEHLYHCLKKG